MKVCGNQSTPWQDTEFRFQCQLKKGHTGPHAADRHGETHHWCWGRHQSCHFYANTPTEYMPLYTSHRTSSEGGRKTHLAITDRLKASLCGIPERYSMLGNSGVFLADIGDPIEDLRAWYDTGPDELCRCCAKLAGLTS